MVRWKTKWMLFCYESAIVITPWLLFDTQRQWLRQSTLQWIMPLLLYWEEEKNNWEKKKKSFMALTVYMATFEETSGRQLTFVVNSAHFGFPFFPAFLSIRGTNSVFPLRKLNYINCYKINIAWIKMWYFQCMSISTYINIWDLSMHQSMNQQEVPHQVLLAQTTLSVTNMFTRQLGHELIDFWFSREVMASTSKPDRLTCTMNLFVLKPCTFLL